MILSILRKSVRYRKVSAIKHVRYREVPLYWHRGLKTKDPLCHLGNEWRHTFQTFHIFHWVSKLFLNRRSPSTLVFSHRKTSMTWKTIRWSPPWDGTLSSVQMNNFLFKLPLKTDNPDFDSNICTKWSNLDCHNESHFCCLELNVRSLLYSRLFIYYQV